MTQYKCPLCGSQSYKEKQHYRSKSPEFANRMIVQCDNCKLMSVYPLPTDEELKGYYKSYWERQKEDYQATMPLFKAQAKARYGFLKPYLANTNTINVLDVGAGFGLIKDILQRNLKKSSLSYDAVETDPLAIEYLKAKIKPRNIYSNLDDCKFMYNIIILSHILEHLKEPLSFLKKEKIRLVDDGILFIEVPNQDYLHKLRNEPHIIFLNPQTIIRLVEEAGYEILKIATCGERLVDLVQENDIKTQKLSLWERLNRRIQGKKSNMPFKESIRNVSVYGPQRRWIRLIAAVKRSK